MSPDSETPADEYERRLAGQAAAARRRLREAIGWWGFGQIAAAGLVLAAVFVPRFVPTIEYLFASLSALAWMISFGGAAAAVGRTLLDFSVLSPRWIVGGLLPWLVVTSEMLSLCLLPGI